MSLELKKKAEIIVKIPCLEVEREVAHTGLGVPSSSCSVTSLHSTVDAGAQEEELRDTELVLHQHYQCAECHHFGMRQPEIAKIFIIPDFSDVRFLCY